ncbi:glutathione S-transferase family protein [Roseicyclus sp.]|uniref:glutathione S-transferase family protein n=1 Tax=Roseicyclus sp. TaxID=1914329 RepID=UPI003F9F7997
MAATDLTLYATPVSVYCCKVRVGLALKGLDWTELPPPGGYGSAEYREIVPQGTVPALVQEGFVLAESDAILEYLDEIGAGAPLLPGTPRARARARALSRFVDTRLEPAARALFAFVGGAPVPGDRRDALLRHLDTLSALAGPGPYLGGDGPALPDCGLFAVAEVLAMLGRVLRLPLPDLTGPGRAHPVAGPHLRTYAGVLTDWAKGKGAAA